MYKTKGETSRRLYLKLCGKKNKKKSVLLLKQRRNRLNGF